MSVAFGSKMPSTQTAFLSHNASHNTWPLILKAEIDSARDLLNVAKIRQLAELYDGVEMHDEALSLINRVVRFKLDRSTLLPLMLDSLIRQCNLAKLNQAVRLVLQMRDRSPELRRILSRALVLLGQIEPAAQEWAAILAENSMGAADWSSLALFLAEHGDVENLRHVLDAKFFDASEESLEPAALFCVLRSQFDENPDRSREILAQIPIDAINDADLSFELAIVAFRLGDFPRARAAAEHALVLNPDSATVSNALPTFITFNGETVPDLRPVQIPLDAMDAVKQMGREIPATEYSWGIIQNSEGVEVAVPSEPFDPLGSCVLDVSVFDNATLTYSVLPEVHLDDRVSNHGTIDPLELLSYVDWSVPHLMLQRQSKLPTSLHLFIGASGHRDWYWQEVEPEPVGRGENLSVFESERCRIWGEALKELETREREETCQ